MATADQISIAVLAHKVAELEKQNVALIGEVAAIEERNRQRDADRAKMERNQLLYGIMLLGGVVTTLFGILWNYRGIIFQGGGR